VTEPSQLLRHRSKSSSTRHHSLGGPLALKSTTAEMNPSKFTLSKRATAQMEATAKSPLFSAIFRTFGNQVSSSSSPVPFYSGLSLGR
jgi:hypothetical protein